MPNNFLSDEDQQKLAEYMQKDPNEEAKKLALQKLSNFVQTKGESDPTMNNMVQGIAMGSVGTLPSAVERGGANMAKPAFNNVRQLFTKEAPEAAQSIEQLSQKANQLADQLGYHHPEAKKAWNALLRRKDMLGQ